MLDRLRRIFAARQVPPAYQPEARHVVIGNVTVGVNISNPEETLKVSTVWRCVNLKANAIGTLPWPVYRRNPQTGARAKFPGHPVEVLLNERPNPEMTAFQFRTTMVQHKLLYGNAYAEIERDGRGRPVNIWPIAPDRVEPWRMADGTLAYKVGQPTGGNVMLGIDDVFHVPGLGWDGIRGYSILEVGLQSLGAAYAMDRFAGNYFGRGMQPSGVLEVPPEIDLDEEGLERLRNEVLRVNSGWRKAQEPLILDQGMKYQQMSTDPDKGQLLDTRKFSVFDVCRWFGVPPYLAFASDEEPRANVETQSREFLMYGLDPEIVAFEQEATRKMFVVPGFEARMNTDEFMRGDLAARAEYYTKMRHLGVFNIDDILELEGRDPIGGPVGQTRVMQVQFQPIDQATGAPTATLPGTAGVPGEAGAMNGKSKRVNGHANGGTA